MTDKCYYPEYQRCQCVSCCERRAEEQSERRYIAMENQREWQEQEWDRMGVQ